MENKPFADPRILFFDSIANEWDGWHDLPAQAEKLHSQFEAFNIQPSETVLDIGCGTGNLTRVLLDRLGPSGHIIAVDISPDMLKRARQKIRDPRVVWFQAPASRVPVEDISCDRVICFSSWPHFRNQTAVIREFHRVLKRNGFIHILHFMSREEVNRIHGQAHPSVYEDQLVPIEEVTALFEQNGFSLFETFDDAHRYLLTVQKEQ